LPHGRGNPALGGEDVIFEVLALKVRDSNLERVGKLTKFSVRGKY
jgi:hypothetical protein